MHGPAFVHAHVHAAIHTHAHAPLHTPVVSITHALPPPVSLGTSADTQRDVHWCSGEYVQKTLFLYGFFACALCKRMKPSHIHTANVRNGNVVLLQTYETVSYNCAMHSHCAMQRTAKRDCHLHVVQRMHSLRRTFVHSYMNRFHTTVQRTRTQCIASLRTHATVHTRTLKKTI